MMHNFIFTKGSYTRNGLDCRLLRINTRYITHLYSMHTAHESSTMHVIICITSHYTVMVKREGGGGGGNFFIFPSTLPKYTKNMQLLMPIIYAPKCRDTSREKLIPMIYWLLSTDLFSATVHQ